MSVITSVFSKTFLATVSALVMVAGMLFGANIATADSVWVQSYERSSQTQACEAQPGETQWQASWGANSSWSPSWEQWANNGNGGWVCTRSIAWARTPTAASSGGGGGSVTYALGDTGPGGGLVFLISGGKTYEMAPKNWDDPTNVSAVDPKSAWCSNTSDLLSGTFGTVVGTGQANTALMVAAGACATGAANLAIAPAYRGGGYDDWFLPSKDELSSMYDYKSSIVDAAKYGFVDDVYWSSSQLSSTRASRQYFTNGSNSEGNKTGVVRVRPVRAF